jgi:hypothetical protein
MDNLDTSDTELEISILSSPMILPDFLPIIGWMIVKICTILYANIFARMQAFADDQNGILDCIYPPIRKKL